MSALDLDVRIRQLVQNTGHRLTSLDAHHHLPELRVRADPDRGRRHPPVHRPHTPQLMREPEHRPRRRIERGHRQQIEPDTGAEVAGTNVSVEDETAIKIATAAALTHQNAPLAPTTRQAAAAAPDHTSR
ncbi:hypothetical protein [Amycolatopsis sp. WQ 127309]|uniref:hypothetical protein n=1 Tax=Amycolatopsis sp. WQ 127309 TaxID=2932773 RepID=UPI001FF1D482|nr:hypothetical protein [Amycolatopsis sp. WQ 127309]UOZ07068.1 hypothetical protein MUY22_01875 [Amycolatopsis sp. WQ 127309]